MKIINDSTKVYYRFIISLEQQMPKCFIPLIPHQFAKDHIFFYLLMNDKQSV